MDHVSHLGMDTGMVPSPYNPLYDPLVAATPAANQAYPPSYWAATAGPPPPDDGPVAGDVDVDVAIIGAGYTGLSAAIFLARTHGIKATVLEANRPAWGCSGRNGGQGQNATGRLSRAQWVRKWGLDTALRLHAEIGEGFETFRNLISDIDCEPQPGGHLLIAHRDRIMKKLDAEQKFLKLTFDYETELLDADVLRIRYVNQADAKGALHEPLGISVHPMKLAFGYLNRARALGAKVHSSSPVTGWATRGGVHYLTTPGGIVRARAVGVATGGYTTQHLHPALTNRFMPVLSNAMVTRPLTKDEIEACNFRTTQALTDTRTLRFYYRLLPDNRIHIGSRSAITGADAGHARHKAMLANGLARKFPALAGIEIDYFWSGWVDISHDMMPRIVQPDPRHAFYYALGYGGNGVSYSARAGQHLADWIAGKGRHLDLPIFTTPLPLHPLAPFRRLGQSALYRLYYLRDEML
jgi:glycine/D-amino acid oxidase-like deaminating enzyme